MFLQFDEAGAVRYDHRHSVVVDFLLDDSDVFFVVLRERHDVADVFRCDAESFAYLTNLVVCR